MKRTVKMISITMLLIIVLSAVACGKKAEPVQTSEPAGTATAEDLWGTWKGTGGEISTVSFAKDGSYRDDAGDGLYISGTYTVNEDAQTITVNEDEYGMVFVYNFSVSDNTLSLQMDGGKERRFVR